MYREPFLPALLPLIISLITLVGFIRGSMAAIWLGGAALVFLGLAGMCSLDLWNAGVGLVVLLMALILSRSAARERSQHSTVMSFREPTLLAVMIVAL
jgi:membrane protein implicated in regulation of membrane protease activity